MKNKDEITLAEKQTIKQILDTAKSYGFKAQISQFDEKTVWIWSDFANIEKATNYDDLYCDLGAISTIDFQTDEDKMEVWIKG